MPVVDISFLNPKYKRSGGSGYNVLSTHLSIKEAQLKSDGNPSPGDYKSLRDDALKAAVSPGLTASERSNFEVKAANYDSLSKTTVLRDAQDIDNMNRAVKNDNKKLTVAFGNDPQLFLRGKLQVLEGKMFRLRENVADQKQAGDESYIKTSLELDSTENEWLDVQAALETVGSYQKGGNPIEGFVVNVETNSKGEIRDIEVSREPKSGYIATTGVLGGFSVYGKVNPKVGVKEGMNVFKIGNEVFSAGARLRPGPNGTFEPDVLTAKSQQMPLGRGVKATSNFVDLDPINIKPQRDSNPGDWVQSTDGSFYKDIGNRQYERYINATKDQLQINDFDILKNLPEETLKVIKQRTIKTIDNTPPYVPPPTSDIPFGPTQSSVSENKSDVNAGASYSRTPSPLERAPKSALGTAVRATQGAVNYLKSIFGK